LTRPVDDLVIFDGVCNLCNGSVRFILRHEAAPVLRFVPFQSPAGERLMRKHGFDPSDVRTFVLLADGRVYVKSDAAIRIARHFRGAWRYLALGRVVPRPIRDRAYDLVARNRYRWFGRIQACMVPTPELRARFVQD
jgi:predicted DCC family thiol-disulfide oxidoreductase YuxK